MFFSPSKLTESSVTNYLTNCAAIKYSYWPGLPYVTLSIFMHYQNLKSTWKEEYFKSWLHSLYITWQLRKGHLTAPIEQTLSSMRCYWMNLWLLHSQWLIIPILHVLCRILCTTHLSLSVSTPYNPDLVAYDFRFFPRVKLLLKCWGWSGSCRLFSKVEETLE